MNLITQKAIAFVESGRVPDALVRMGIRRILRQRLNDIHHLVCEQSSQQETAFRASMANSPAALVPDLANQQHYEVPAAFFTHVLGKHRKYSCGYWDKTVTCLDEAESLALRISAERAGLTDGQSILELGCGWGSLTLWMGAHYPKSKIKAVSNSNSQREHILCVAKERGLNNIEVVTCDMNLFNPNETYDRIVSIEMFEHMRNWPLLFQRIADWLKPDGRFFMHVFVHQKTPYAFEVNDASDWMSRFFFSGGMMPSDDLAVFYQDHLKLTHRWRWCGTHYQRTANAWLANMDSQYERVYPILKQTYGEQDAQIWWVRWRLFFMACAELFGYRQGQEWWVSHYLFEKRRVHEG